MQKIEEIGLLQNYKPVVTKYNGDRNVTKYICYLLFLNIYFDWWNMNNMDIMFFMCWYFHTSWCNSDEGICYYMPACILLQLLWP